MRPGNFQCSVDQIQARKLPYYHPQLRNSVEVMQAMDWCKDIDGSFLLRNSFSIEGSLTVSVWYKKKGPTDGLKHFNIKSRRGVFYLQDREFPTLEDLMRFHANTDVPNEERLAGLRLAHPITELEEYIDLSRLNLGAGRNRAPSEGAIPAKRVPFMHSISSPGLLQTPRRGSIPLSQSIPLSPGLPPITDSDTYQLLGKAPEVPDGPRPPKPTFGNRLSGSSNASSLEDDPFDVPGEDDIPMLPTRVSGKKTKKEQEKRRKSSSDKMPQSSCKGSRPPLPPRKSIS